MRKQPAYFAALLGALGFWVCLDGVQQPLQAAAGTYAALVDTDGDGLDDLLEFRLGTNPEAVDTDADGLSDHEELLAATDPLVWEDTSQITPAAGLYADLYALGDTFYLMVSAVSQSGATAVKYSLANQQRIFTVPAVAARPFLAKVDQHSSSNSGWNIQQATYAFPLSMLSNQPSSAIAVTAILDGVQFSQTRVMTKVDYILSEIRIPSGDLGRSTGNGDPVGGISPLEPAGGGEPPHPGSADEVCVQTLEAIGNMGGGRVAYRVVEAACMPMASAICFTGCATSVEDIIIGIDIVGLLGG